MVLPSAEGWCCPSRSLAGSCFRPHEQTFEKPCPISLFPGAKFKDEVPWGDDSEAVEARVSFKLEEVDVTRYQEIRSAVHGGREQMIVVGVAGSDDGFDLAVDPYGIDREQMKKASWIEALKLPHTRGLHIGENPMIFAVDAIGDYEREAPGMPQMQNFERRTRSTQYSTDDDVGIENNTRTPRGRHGSRCELALRGGRLLRKSRRRRGVRSARALPRPTPTRDL